MPSGKPFCTQRVPKCNTANQLPCSNTYFHRHIFPLKLDRSVWLQGPVSTIILFVETNLKKKRLLGNQNWAKYKSNFDRKNQIKIVIATNYAIWNMQMYSVSCKNACSTLWFFFQMPCFDSTILQYFAEYSMDQKYM